MPQNLRLDIVVHTSPVDQQLLSSILSTLQVVIKNQEVLMADQKDLDSKVDELTVAQQAEAKRQQDQDAATEQQILVLQQAVTDLQAQVAAGTPIDTAPTIAKIQSVIDSLNAEQPTPPVA